MPADTIAPSRPHASGVATEKTRYLPGDLNRPEEGSTTLSQANDSLQRIGAACLTVGSDHMAVLTETGALTGRLMTDIIKSYIDTLNYAAVTCAALGRDSLTCRTPADVVEFQKRALEGFTETYEASSKVYSHLFENVSAAFEPLMVRAADGPERLFRAFAD